MHIPNETLSSSLHQAGIRGDLSQIAMVPCDAPAAAACPEEIDFPAIAKHAMNYLTRNPVPQYEYQTRFQCSPLGLPPMPAGRDPISIGDTDGRMDWEFRFMRDILGQTEPTEVELHLRRRMMSYLRDDHLAWCENGAAEEGKVYEGENITPGLGMSPWTTGLILASLSMEYERTGDRAALEKARLSAHALTKLATWDTGRAYFAEGFGPWVNGKVLKSGWERQFPMDGLHLMFYVAASGDEEILRYCQALADGFIAELQPNRGIARIFPDGSHRAHAHITMRAVWGVAWLGEVTGQPKYLDFARRVYEFQRQRGYDTGWFSAAYWDTTAARLCETCATADMISTATHLARAGWVDYWDHVERYVRNYIRHAQFFITPEYEAYFRSLYPDRQGEVDQALVALRDFEGGFCGAPGPNDMVDWLFGSKHMNVSGCCSPEGMRSIYTAWKNTVIEKASRIDVNMSFPVNAPAATVTTALPRAGCVTVTPHRSKDVYIRPPSWTVRSEVRAYANGQSIPAQWRGDYVYFASPQAGEKLTITYPLLTFHQKQSISLHGGLAAREGGETSGYTIAYGQFDAKRSGNDASEAPVVEDSEITFAWRGNEVTAATPNGPFIPMYNKTH